MPQAAVSLALLTAALALGTIGIALALVGVGVPFVLAALLPAAAAGLVQYAAMRALLAKSAGSETEAVRGMQQQMEEYRAAVAAMRHDLRGILSPALMMSDRLLCHADPTVQRAGQAVVRSIERATTALSANRETLSGGATLPAP